MAREVAVKQIRMRGARRQRGVSLIEILVAVVLLAVGLLGLAGLQVRGMQVNQGSQWRSMAAIMADDLADRMRAVVDLTASSTAPTSATGFAGAFNVSTATAAGDPSMQNWIGTSLDLLPAGTVIAGAPVPPCGSTLPCVNVAVLPSSTTPASPSAIEIDVYWNDARAAGGANLIPGPPGPGAAAGTVGSYHVVTML
jgi:type IV pilus assembly protein PilV